MPSGGESLDTTLGFNLSAGYVLGEGKHHELSLSLGSEFWAESEINGHTYNYGRNTTTVWVDHQPIEIPATNGKITISDGKIQMQDGTIYHTDYHPALDVFPLMANYRCYFGDEDGRVRLYLGGGAGFALVYAYSYLLEDSNDSFGSAKLLQAGSLKRGVRFHQSNAV